MLLLAEAGLRMGGIGGTNEGLSNYAFDPILGWSPHRERAMFRSSPFFEAHFVHFNPDGFATDEAGLHQAADRKRPSLALVGDSFTEAFQLPYEQTFASRLAQARPDLQVLNLGVGGYSPDQYLLSARHRLKGFNVSQLVVVIFPWNDFPYVEHPVYQDYHKPFFGGDDYSKAPDNTPLPAERAVASKRSLTGRIADSSAVYSVLRRFIKTKISPIKVLPVPAESLPYPQAAMAKSMAMVAQIRNEHPQSQFTCYVIPVYEELLDDKIWRDNLARLRLVSEALELEIHSPAELLLKDGDPAKYYIAGDGHFNARGAALVAAHLEQILAESSAEAQRNGDEASAE